MNPVKRWFTVELFQSYVIRWRRCIPFMSSSKIPLSMIRKHHSYSLIFLVYICSAFSSKWYIKCSPVCGTYLTSFDVKNRQILSLRMSSSREKDPTLEYLVLISSSVIYLLSKTSWGISVWLSVRLDSKKNTHFQNSILIFSIIIEHNEKMSEIKNMSRGSVWERIHKGLNLYEPNSRSSLLVK
jgi:hypothetical protein